MVMKFFLKLTGEFCEWKMTTKFTYHTDNIVITVANTPVNNRLTLLASSYILLVEHPVLCISYTPYFEFMVLVLFLRQQIPYYNSSI